MALHGELIDGSVRRVDPLSIRAQGLRPSFIEAFELKGIRKLYEWQASAVQAAGRVGKSFVYSAPTSGGKSLVADVLMIHALQRSITNWHRLCKKALVLVPYLSIGVIYELSSDNILLGCDVQFIAEVHAAAERCEHLTDLCRKSHLRVKGYASSESGCPFSNPRENIAVCSYEKGNSALNRLVAKGLTDDLCCVVIDEFHMLVDSGRGPALEVLISKLRYFAPQTQLICISATMRGLGGVRAWLDAELFQTDFRPVKLKEHVVLGQAVFCVQGNPSAPGDSTDTSAAPEPPVHAPDLSKTVAFPNDIVDTFKDAGLHVIRSLSLPDDSTARQAGRQAQIGDRVALHLAMEGMQCKGGCLVFCKSRKGCEVNAAEMSKMVDQATVSEADRAARITVAMNLLADQSARAHEPLQELLLAATGVAYHHAELSACERRTVEQAFRNGVIHTLFCTTTLAAGINLPASMCIIRCHNDRQALKRSDYVQMIGRAGRAGYSATGQSYLVCDYHVPLQDAAKPHAVSNNQGSARTALRIIQAQVAELKSNLIPTGWERMSAKEQLACQGAGLDAMKKLVLEVMMLRSLTTRDVFGLMHVTLAAFEIRCAQGTSTPDDVVAVESQENVEEQQMQALYHCGLAALRDLNREALVNNFDDDGAPDPADREFPATGLGRAVFDSGLPLTQARKLHSLLNTARTSLSCDTHPLHLLWVLLQSVESPAQIGSWSAYVKLIQMESFLTDDIKTFAGLVQLLPREGPQRDKLLRPNRPPSKDVRVQHGTFLIAICLSRILSEECDPQEAVVRWTCATPKGPSLMLQAVSGRAMLKLLKDDIAQQAAMAALLCESAGWTQLAALLSMLSADASAGSRPELRELLQVDGLDARRARALFNAGLKTPLAVLKADSSSLKEALVKALPVSMQRHTGPHVKGGTREAAQIGLGTDIGANQLLIRSVESVTSLVGKHFHQLFTEKELELAAGEMDAADLSASYSSYNSQQAVPSPTQISSQRPQLGNTALTQTQTHSNPPSQAVAGNVGGSGSRTSQHSHQVLLQPSHVMVSQQVAGYAPGVFRTPLQASQLHGLFTGSHRGQQLCVPGAQLLSCQTSGTQQVQLTGPAYLPNQAEPRRSADLGQMQPNKMPRWAVTRDSSQIQTPHATGQASAPAVHACWASSDAGRPLGSQLRSQSQSAPGRSQFGTAIHQPSLPQWQDSAGSAMQPCTGSIAFVSGRPVNYAAMPHLPGRHV